MLAEPGSTGGVPFVRVAQRDLNPYLSEFAEIHGKL